MFCFQIDSVLKGSDLSNWFIGSTVTCTDVMFCFQIDSVLKESDLSNWFIGSTVTGFR